MAVGAARRRRDRRLRAFLKHERLSVAMNMATVQHHPYMKSAVVDFCVQVGSPLAAVTEYVAPAPAVALSVPSQLLRPATVAPGVNLDVTGLVYPQFSSTAVEGSASQVVGSLPLGEVSVAPGVNLDVTGLVHPLFSTTSVEVSASQVVGSLPLGEVFAAPVFHQVHQEQRGGSDTTENFANFPVVQEQGVVGSLPPAEEFTVPVFTAFHQEQFSASETTENIPDFPVVQEQVLVQAIPRLVGSSPPVDESTVCVAMRPSPLVEVWPSVRAQRHAVEGLGEFAPMVQILDAPVPQMVDHVAEALRLLDRPIAEQVSAVPTVSCSSCPSRSCVPEPQSADQLVEVPTVLTPTRIALQIAEQIVDTLVEEDEDDDDELLEYFCESCEFLELQANVWQSLGHGVARLLRHSCGAVFFQFWLGEQLIIDDVVKAVGRPRLKLRPGRSGRSWVWSDPECIGGPSEYGHAVRFASQELVRRFHGEWAATG